MTAEIRVMVGRIETLTLDAVVNAANRELRPGTGVDGALRQAAGPALTQLTQTLTPIGEGEAVLTPGFSAPARHIIHTAAPIWFLSGDETHKIAALGNCYRNSIALAAADKLGSIAFPCLGTGNFGWPRELACRTAIAACREALAHAPTLTLLLFCCFSEEDVALYRAELGG